MSDGQYFSVVAAQIIPFSQLSLSIRSVRKKCDFSGLYKEHSVAIRNLLSLEDYEAAKLRAGVVTVFDLRKLGESLASFEFTDS